MAKDTKPNKETKEVKPSKWSTLKGWQKALIIIVGIIVLIKIITPSGGTKEPSNEGKSDKVVSAKEVTLIDFSAMPFDEITNWCETSKIKCERKGEYSDVVAKDSFISQSVQSGDKVREGKSVTITYSLGKEPTAGQKNALKKAHSYLSFSAFSYKGLIKQLEFEEFSKEEATYAVDNCGADWNEQAYKKAKSYLKTSSFSLQSLIKQLEFEEFTTEQAQYGADKAYKEQ